MEEKDVIKRKKSFNLSKWLFIMVAIMSFISIIFALKTRTVPVLSFVISNVEVIICSLFLAFVQVDREGK